MKNLIPGAPWNPNRDPERQRGSAAKASDQIRFENSHEAREKIAQREYLITGAGEKRRSPCKFELRKPKAQNSPGKKRCAAQQDEDGQ